MHYSVTIFAVSLSILNSIHYEYQHSRFYIIKNIFTIQDYIRWKRKNLKTLKYYFGTIEYILKITFFYHSFPIRDFSPYSISILLLHLNIGVFIIFVKLCIIYFIYWIAKTLYNIWKYPKKYKKQVKNAQFVCKQMINIGQKKFANMNFIMIV